jgi:GGDEF domain-containing protein
VTLSAAIGVAVAAPLEEDAGALLRRADAAMYAAKREGPGRVALSDPT